MALLYSIFCQDRGEAKSTMNTHLLLKIGGHASFRRAVTVISAKHVLLSKRALSSLPYHLVVGLPALSPTMSSGSLAEWYVAEGDSFSAGDALAKIETDKASIDFESQDDGFVAKILQEAGTGKDIEVGAPIMVTVEEEEHISAFKDYVPPVSDIVSIPKQENEPDSAVAASSPPPSPPPPTPAPAVVSESHVSPAVSPSITLPPTTPTAAAPVISLVSSSVTPAWGMAVATKSPLSKTLSVQQLSYIEKYGSTGQRPLAA